MGMFTLDPSGVFRADALSGVTGLVHGFGTRDAPGWPDLPTASVSQVHSSRIVFAGGPGVQGEADALITDKAGFVLAVRTADCVPILVADPEHHAAAAIHAGWRGTAAEILTKALTEMSKRFDTAPEKVVVAIGPAIGACCFEVGPEVAVQFGQAAQKTHIDLIEANRQQALSAGVPVGQITTARHCTRCDAALFHSFRRDKEHSGRMVAAVGWMPGHS
jgi:polyphenol oxidase